MADEFDTIIDGVPHKVSRWAINFIDDTLRNQSNVIQADLWGQNDKKHGPASIQARITVTPSTFKYRKDGTQQPVIGVRIFHGGAQQVINEIAYYFHYGYMRCNIAQDAHLQEGVYAYVDILSASKKLDRTSPIDRVKCIGIIEGYLKHRHDDKISPVSYTHLTLPTICSV